MTSSTCAGSTSGTRRSSSRTHCTAMSSGRARLNEPRNDLARPLRTLATIIASTIGVPIGLRGPARPAFPEERGDALARVRMREQARERGGLGPQPVAEQSAARLTQERLDHREHVRRLRRERARDRRRGVEDLGRRDHLLHESPLRGAASGDGLAAEDHEPRAAGSDDAWQPLRAAATRQDADADFGQADARVLGRDPDVARERDLERATHAEAVDRDDEWLWERLDAVGEALDTLPARVGIRLEERRELRDVGPGAEAARPRAAQERDARRSVGRERIQRRLERADDRPAHRVHRRTIDRDRRHAARPLEVDELRRQVTPRAPSRSARGAPSCGTCPPRSWVSRSRTRTRRVATISRTWARGTHEARPRSPYTRASTGRPRADAPASAHAGPR